jgi:hypothetical protein
MPYRMAFIESELWDDWFFVELWLDSMFFIDVWINFLSAYYNTDGKLITNRRKI